MLLFRRLHGIKIYADGRAGIVHIVAGVKIPFSVVRARCGDRITCGISREIAAQCQIFSGNFGNIKSKQRKQRVRKGAVKKRPNKKSIREFKDFRMYF